MPDVSDAPPTPQKFLQQIRIFERALTELNADRAKIQHDNARFAYSIDWDCFYGYIWKKSTPNVPIAKNYGERLTQSLIQSAGLELPFDTLFTPYTFFEFLDSLEDHVKDIEGASKNFQTFNRNREAICRLDLNDASDLVRSTGLAESTLRMLKNALSGSGVSQYIDRASQVFGVMGAVKGIEDLGDTLDIFNNDDLKFVRECLVQMWSLRSSSDDRGAWDKEFHYLIDVLNLVISIKFSKESGRPHRLVTGLSRYHTVRNEYVRNPLVPHFWISSELLFKTKPDYQGKNSQNDEYPPPGIFLESALTQTKDLIKQLSAIENNDELPKWALNSVFKYYSDYATPLNDPQKAFVSTLEDNEELSRLLSSRKAFDERVEAEREKLVNAGKLLAQKHHWIVDSDLLNIEEVDNNAVFQKLIKRYY